MPNSPSHDAATTTAAEPTPTTTTEPTPTFTPIKAPPLEQPKFRTTPFLRKLSGNPNTKKSLQHVHMDPALKEELFESQLLDVPGLVEHLFPDSCFPIPFTDLKSAVYKKHWNKWLDDWKDYNALYSAASAPVLKAAPGTGETLLAKFFNGLSKTLVDTCRRANRSVTWTPYTSREWTSDSSRPLEGGPHAKRKPDVCLVEAGQDATWMSTLVTVELKSKSSEHRKALMQLTNSAYMIFSTQDERRFYIGMSVCHTDVCVYVFDRSGVVGSKKFHLAKESSLLIRVLAGLILTDVDAIGLDSSIRHHKDGTRSIYVDHREYKIVKTLFISDTIRGRGTVCWQARRNNVDYVIKNTWTDSSRIRTEGDILLAAKGVEGIAHLVGEEIVQYEGKDDSTASIRSIIRQLDNYRHKEWYDRLEVRLHRRLVTTPFAESLAHFKSKKELLTVLIGAIEAHSRLVEKHILHRDISISNVMIYRLPAPIKSEEATERSKQMVPPAVNQPVQGILVDLDYALVTHDDMGKKVERKADAAGHRTGTLPFMATEILTGLPPGEEHQPYHDLESFFYVLLWISLQYAGPSVERQDIDIENEERIKGWLQGRDIYAVGVSKAMAMTTFAENFYKGVTSLCTPYFADLVPCIEELRQKIFYGGPGKKATHQDIIDVLRKPLEWLPDDDGWSSECDPAGYGVNEGKRKLATHSEDEDEDEDDEESHTESSPFRAKAKRAKTASFRAPRVPTRRSVRIRSMAPLEGLS